MELPVTVDLQLFFTNAPSSSNAVPFFYIEYSSSGFFIFLLPLLCKKALLNLTICLQCLRSWLE